MSIFLIIFSKLDSETVKVELFRDSLLLNHHQYQFLVRGIVDEQRQG
ncbi:MAG: hypothetical protein KA717_02265 [Woronichinia naegeliana WA131]|uniref:Uncharacterized protein n=1 Tax=Woronichinia naegeliana WA131 TaxID=2824559 RepID=A0A977KXJ9_9CYAN|nr:MAG: hypothetical protein KA717_02265 [Woronichinia naegeliana WA131]